MTSVTTVGAFETVGAILVVALMIVPAATAYLLTNNLKQMLFLAGIFGVIGAVGGYWIAHILDASVAGSMASTLGVCFFLVFLLAPDRGLLSVLIRQKSQQKEFSLLTFLLHLMNHSNNPEEADELTVGHLTDHFRWSRKQADQILDMARENGMIAVKQDIVTLSEKGEAFTKEAFSYILLNKPSELEKMKRRFLLFRG
jgi:manganese/zinc/iron transport system permease protein